SKNTRKKTPPSSFRICPLPHIPNSPSLFIHAAVLHPPLFLVNLLAHIAHHPPCLLEPLRIIRPRLALPAVLRGLPGIPVAIRPASLLLCQLPEFLPQGAEPSGARVRVLALVGEEAGLEARDRLCEVKDNAA